MNDSMDGWKMVFMMVFFFCVALWILLLLALIEDLESWKLNRCYKKNGGNLQCGEKKCLQRCYTLQNEKWVVNLEKKAARGDLEAKGSLEFYYRYE